MFYSPPTTYAYNCVQSNFENLYVPTHQMTDIANYRAAIAAKRSAT